MKSLRVLMITSEWPQPGVSYTPHFIKRQADFLRAAGVEVDVFHFHGAKNPFNYLKAWLKAQQRMRDRDYDLVHAQFGQSGLLAIPKRLPLVVTFRGSDLLGTIGDRKGTRHRASALHRRLSRLVARCADAVIVVAEHMKRELPDDVVSHVIPSGLDLQTTKPMARRAARTLLGLPQDERLVLFVGNPMALRKRHSLAQQAVKLVNERLPTRLVLAWGVEHAQVPIFMSACDALIFTSMQEGSPNVVKEALACNLPVVSTAVGDVPDRLKTISGCEVCFEDSPQAIASALEKVLRLGQRIEGRQAVADLDESVTTAKVLKIYEEVLSKRQVSIDVPSIGKVKASQSLN